MLWKYPLEKHMGTVCIVMMRLYKMAEKGIQFTNSPEEMSIVPWTKGDARFGIRNCEIRKYEWDDEEK